MADVLRMPAGAFGHVPTPALVAPLEFTMPSALYAAIGGHVGAALPIERVLAEYAADARRDPAPSDVPWPGNPA
jgi:hypothetical protein